MEPVEQTTRVFSDRYELTHLIARGGMAQVYRARDVAGPARRPQSAVPRAVGGPDVRGAVPWEAQAAANLSHPNIVQVFDWGEDTGTYFIVMEYIDGQPLSTSCGGQGPPGGPGRRVVALSPTHSYAHRRGVVHRDVKPGNGLIADGGG